MTGKQRKQLFGALHTVLILIAMFVMLVPIVWIFLAAFKTHVDVYQLKLFFTPTLENFAVVFDDPYRLGEKLYNSTIVALVTVLFAIPIATLAAYSFSRFSMFGETAMLVTILATQFLPAVVIILPFFIMFRDIGLLDTRLGLILVNLDGIPMDTEEAAMVDGSSRLQVIWNIVLPMAAPGLLTSGIFCFIIAWNEFLFALILTNKEAVTLPIGLALFKGEEGDLWNLLSAAGIIIMAPMFILTLMIRKYFVQGMTMGAVR
jgi:multiple sugar transport system permease protein